MLATGEELVEIRVLFLEFSNLSENWKMSDFSSENVKRENHIK